MTIATTSSSIIVSGTGAQFTFDFPFVGDSADNISVYYIDADGVQTLLSPSQYTLVLNAAATNQLWSVGGSVTYPLSGSAIAVGTFLQIQRTIPLTQQITVRNQGNYYAQVTEQALDLLEMQIQQVSARTGQQRGVWATDTKYNFGDIIQDGANGNDTGNYYTCIITNVSGVWATDLANGYWSLTFNVQEVEQYADEAAASAAAALVSQNAAASSASSASMSASTATTQAGIATTQAGIATTQAGIATEAAQEAEDYAEALTSTSSTSVLIGTGSKSFTTQMDKQYQSGQYVIISSSALATNYMHGQVTSYSGTSLVIDIQDVGGSGTFADWNISISGTRGTAGAGTGAIDSGTSGQISYYATNGTTISGSPALTDSSGRIRAFSGASGANNLSYSFLSDTNTGFYGSASDEVSWQTGGSDRIVIGSSGFRIVNSAAIGAAITTGMALRVGISPTGATTTRTIYASNSVQSDVTSSHSTFQSQVGTAAASFTLVNLQHFHATQASLGAGSSITAQYGFRCDGITNAASNYGFYSNVDTASGAWNFYANGTANNYFAGSVGIGSPTINANAIVHVTTTTKQSIPAPVMTTAQRTALTGVEGGQVFDSDLNVPFFYNGSGWVQTSPDPKGSQVIASGSGNFTTPANTTSTTQFKFTLTGGGAGGAGGAGGGAGSTAIYYVTGLAASQTCAYSIGAGGGGGTSGNNGVAGTQSTVTIGATTVTAPGGGVPVAGINQDGGAGGGAATNATLSIPGGGGGSPAQQGNANFSGYGGASFWGGGGQGVGAASGTIGIAGGAPGSGGSGAASASTGGAGASGVLLIEWN